MADEEIQVQIEDDPATASATTVATSDADPVADLKAQLEEIELEKDAERTRAEAAERRSADERRAADVARREATEARTESADSQLGSIESGISAAEAEAASAEAEYASAMERGDYAASAKAQRRMSKAEATIVRLGEAKDDLSARKTAPRQEETRRTEQPDDQFERHVSQFSTPTAQWMRAHRDWITDPEKGAMLSAAHHNALKAGKAVDTPEYFEHVETRIGLRQEASKSNGSANGNGAAKPVTTRRAAAPSAAPVNGGGGASTVGASDGNTVRLSSREAAAATDGITHVWNYDDPSGQKRFKKGDPIGVQEFARRKLEMQKQGLYDKSLME